MEWKSAFLAFHFNKYGVSRRQWYPGNPIDKKQLFPSALKDAETIFNALEGSSKHIALTHKLLNLDY